MDSRKDMTKRLIADGFKALMLRYPFEKISIMMITNEAGIRRPSFYNHFQDKYDLLAWIVETDVIAPAGEPLRRGDGVGALRTIFAGLVEDAAFYRKAFTDAVQRLLLENAALTPAAGYAGLLSEKTVARFSAICLVSTVKHWLESPRAASVDELVDAYLYLVSHSAWM